MNPSRAVACGAVDQPTILHTDVLVVGAGPAGTSAAVWLARGAMSVTVIDKAVFPRDKCCGDGLTTLALRELEPIGLQPDMVPNWSSVGAAWLRSPSGREVCLPMPTDGLFAATAPRRELDAALLRLARDAGAEVLEGCALVEVTPRGGHVDASVEGPGVAGPSVVRARYLVAADGMWSPTRKMLGLTEPGYRGEWHAIRQYAHHVTGPAADRLYVWFEPDLLPGYAWSFPQPGGRANIGFGVVRDGTLSGHDVNQLWAGLLKRPHIAASLGPDVELEGRSAAWPIPASIDRAALSAGRVLFVGDAARATDVMTGEGIGQALLTGRLAAEAILSTPQGPGPTYEMAVKRELLADHRMSKLLTRLLARPLLARGAVWVVGFNDFTRRNFVRWMFEDEPRAIAFTPRRWHRHFLRRSAPYPHPTPSEC